jgi:TatD DNase family protein
MWVDTHCHLDAAEFDPDRDQVVRRARQAGLGTLIVPAVNRASLHTARSTAHQYGFAYALGFHPLYVHAVPDDDFVALDTAIEAALSDPAMVAVGEIGLDFFDPSAPPAALQEAVLCRQLTLAARHGLPVILHVRRSADRLLACLRQVAVRGGIVHAFNGSVQQAMQFVDRGFCLGFGGAATYTGSRRIRGLFAQLPASALVLETDAPDIPPSWLRHHGQAERNEPAELDQIGRTLALLRQISPAELADLTAHNARRVLPRLT